MRRQREIGPIVSSAGLVLLRCAALALAPAVRARQCCGWALGANVLVLPSTVSLQDYYAADMHGRTIPEEYVTRLAFARMSGVNNLAPKLCVAAEVNTVPVTLTGILPKSEFAAKASWQGMTLMMNPVGTERGCCPTAVSTGMEEDDPAALATTRTIQNLEQDELILGAPAKGSTNTRKSARTGAYSWTANEC